MNPLRDSTTPVTDWYEANQAYLNAALKRVRQLLERLVDGASMIPEAGDTALRTAGDAAPQTPTSPALEILCAKFGLSPFERDVLLVCAGIELDATFPSLCAAAQGDPARNYPTFSLALAVLPGAHWSALSPMAPLRHWRLIETGTGTSLTLSPLRIDERILNFLVGIQHLDDRLIGLIQPLDGAVDLVPSYHKLADRLATIWAQTANTLSLPVVQLCGAEVIGKRAIALEACGKLKLDLCLLSAQSLPPDPRELEALIRLWEREAALSQSALLLDCDDLDVQEPLREKLVHQFVARTSGFLVISSRERLPARSRPIIPIEVQKPTSAEQSAIWRAALGPAAQSLNGHVHALVAQFNLSLMTIQSVSRALMEPMQVAPDRDLGDMLWDGCRQQARPRLDDLAQRIESYADWDDLVLPEAQRQIIRDIGLHVRQRATVYETWGFARKSSRGLGISALFAGASGTGKTLAAEVLANELRLDLYRIDLSQVVSKYIGETEKNLRRVFDAAEEGGAVLLFDEADALFGKRSEVKDSHDRYANIEVSYLLQRMEAYRGLAILTTNMKSALDTAFLRRIRFVVQFPFPDASYRAEIWRRIFPADTPTEGLDMARLARLSVAGGNIRNIALNAAFLAADAGESVRMTHLLRAAQAEYAKLEKPLTEAETGGWN